jgi:hypothetical protein
LHGVLTYEENKFQGEKKKLTYHLHLKIYSQKIGPGPSQAEHLSKADLLIDVVAI